VCIPILGQTTQPQIHFSDLDSGPRTGGENNNGAYVTIYGSDFGPSQGSSAVNIGATPAINYKIWNNTKIAFQIPASAATGQQNITVTVNGVTSNAVPFTVRTNGKIYCVSVNGQDANPGTFAGGCWARIQHAVDVMQPGDTVYARQGVLETTADSEGSVGFARYDLTTGSGTLGNPIAVIGYPGETAQVGQSGNAPCVSSNCIEGFRSGYRNSDYITIANLVVRGKDFAIQTGGNPAVYSPRPKGWRVIGNDFSCPFSRAYAGCVTFSQTDYIYFYGNTIHDSGDVNSDDHGLYFTTDSNHIWAAWNTIANIKGCRGIQVHSSPVNGGGPGDPTGHQQFDIHIHDNLIHDTQCDGIEMSTLDPAQGPVEIYNNVIYNAGMGPFNGGGGGYFACIVVSGGFNQPPDGSGIVEVYNNTLYNCGPFAVIAGYGWGGGVVNKGLTPYTKIRMRNNIIQQPAKRNQPYWYMESRGAPCLDTCDLIQGNNNLFWGNNAPTANPNITGSLNIDPKFVDVGNFDFHITAGSAVANLGAYANAGATPLPPATVSVSISPGSVNLKAGQAQQFAATVANAANTVIWSRNPDVGMISTSGRYTAPVTINAPQTVTVTATSVSDPTKSASAIVTLLVSTPPLPNVSPTSLTFSFSVGGATPNLQIVSVTSTDPLTPLSFTVSPATSGGTNWLMVGPMSGSTPSNFSVGVNAAGLSPGVYSGAISVASTDIPNNPKLVGVTLIVNAMPVPFLTILQNAASFDATGVAPGMIITIRGTSIGPATAASFRLDESGMIGTLLAGTRVLFDGIPAPLLYVSSTQINAVVPYEIAGRPATRLQIELEGIRSNTIDLGVVDTAPGIFTLDATGNGPGTGSGQGAILNENGSINSSANPAQRGSVIVIYATGEGVVNPLPPNGAITGSLLPKPLAPVTVIIGGKRALIEYAGAAPGLVAGVLQVNARIPEDIDPGRQSPANVSVILNVGNQASHPVVFVAVQ